MTARRCRSCGVINGPLHHLGCKGVDWELVERKDGMSEHEDYDEVQARASTTAEIRTTSSTGGQKGVKLERWDLLPMGPLSHLARHFGRGAEKYDDHQWRNGYEYSKGIAALLRHFSTWIQGNDWDVCPDDFEGCSEVRSDGTPFPRQPVEHGFRCYNHTGNHHLDAVMWHSVVLREFVDTYPEHDDRYKPKKSEPVGDDNIKYVDMR